MVFKVLFGDTINMDVVLAMSALNTLRNVIAVDALDTLLRAYSSFIDHHNAISHCATTSSSSSPICPAVEMLLQSASMVESMRDDLESLMDTIKVCSKDLDRHLTRAMAPQQCTFDQASQILVSSSSYLVGWRNSAVTSRGS